MIALLLVSAVPLLALSVALIILSIKGLGELRTREHMHYLESASREAGMVAAWRMANLTDLDHAKGADRNG